MEKLPSEPMENLGGVRLTTYFTEVRLGYHYNCNQNVINYVFRNYVGQAIITDYIDLRVLWKREENQLFIWLDFGDNYYDYPLPCITV